MSDLVKRLEIKAGIIEMGENIAWLSDTTLMREAAERIKTLQDEIAKWKALAEANAQGFEICQKRQERDSRLNGPKCV